MCVSAYIYRERMCHCRQYGAIQHHLHLWRCICSIFKTTYQIHFGKFISGIVWSSTAFHYVRCLPLSPSSNFFPLSTVTCPYTFQAFQWLPVAVHSSLVKNPSFQVHIYLYSIHKKPKQNSKPDSNNCSILWYGIITFRLTFIENAKQLMYPPTPVKK